MGTGLLFTQVCLDLKQNDSKSKGVNMRQQQKVNLEVILQVWNLKFIKKYL